MNGGDSFLKNSELTNNGAGLHFNRNGNGSTLTVVDNFINNNRGNGFDLPGSFDDFSLNFDNNTVAGNSGWGFYSGNNWGKTSFKLVVTRNKIVNNGDPAPDLDEVIN